MLDLLNKARGYYYMDKQEKAFELLTIEALAKEAPYDMDRFDKDVRKKVEGVIEAHLFVIDRRKERNEEKNHQEEILQRYKIIYDLIRIYKVSYESLIKYAQYLFKLEEDEDAYKVLDYLEEVCLDDFKNGEKQALLIKVYNLRGEVLLFRDKEEEAIVYLEKALELYDNVLDGRRKSPLYEEIEILYKNLAWYYQNKDKFKPAEKYYKKALKQSKKNCLSHIEYDALKTFIAFDNLGQCYLMNNKNEETIKTYEDLLDFVFKLDTITMDILEKVKDAYDCIIVLYMKEKDFEKAEAFIKEGREFFNHFASQAKEHPEVQVFIAGFDYHYGLYYYMTNDKKKSEEYFLKTRDQQEKISESDPRLCNEELSRTYYCLARFYQEEGRFEEAEGYFQKRILVLEDIIESPRFFSNYLLAIEDLATFYYKNQDYENAKNEYQALIEISEKIQEKGLMDVSEFLKDCYLRMMQICEGMDLKEEASQWHDKYSKL